MVLLVHAAFATRPWVQEHLPAAGCRRSSSGWTSASRSSSCSRASCCSGPFVARQLAGRAADEAPAPSCGGGRCACSPGYWFALTVLRRAPRSAARRREERVPLLLAAVPVREPERRAGRRARSRGRLRDPAGVEPHRRVRLLPDAPGDRDPCWCGSAAKKATEVQMRYALLALRRRSTCSGSCSASTSSLAQPSWERVAVIWPPNWVDFFAIGMAMATFSARAPRRRAACRRCCGSSATTRRCRGCIAARRRRPELRHVLAARHPGSVRRRVLGALVPVRCLRLLPARAGDVR